MADVNVNNTPEAMYVRALKWDFDGYQWTCAKVPESIKEKLQEIFNKWGIGFHGTKPSDAKGNVVTLYVTDKQFKRVKFTFEKTNIPTTETK